MDAHPSRAAELPRSVHEYDCPHCGERLGDVVEWRGRKMFLRGGVLHRKLDGYCLYCGGRVGTPFGGARVYDAPGVET